jgi:hypothetical protein
MLVCARCRLPATVTRKFDAKEYSGGLTLELQAVQARGSSETDSSTAVTDSSSSSTNAAVAVIADIGNPLQQFDDRDYPVIATVCIPTYFFIIVRITSHQLALQKLAI